MDGCVTVQATTEAGEAEWLLELADSYPFILGIVAWVDLTDPRVGERLDTLQRHPKFKGVRHLVHDEPDDRWLLRPDVLRGLGELAQRGIPFDLLLKPRHLPLVPELAGLVPDLQLVIDHIAKPPIASREMEPWASDLERASKVPHLHVKLSGMITEADPGALVAGRSASVHSSRLPLLPAGPTDVRLGLAGMQAGKCQLEARPGDLYTGVRTDSHSCAIGHPRRDRGPLLQALSAGAGRGPIAAISTAGRTVIARAPIAAAGCAATPPGPPRLRPGVGRAVCGFAGEVLVDEAGVQVAGAKALRRRRCRGRTRRLF